MATRIARTVRLGISSLLLHKLRSLLTTFGVLFGTASVIAMLAIGEGASHEAQEQIKLLGSHNVILRSVRPEEQASTSGSSQNNRVAVYGLTIQDLERVRDTFPGVARVVPARVLSEEVRVGARSTYPRILATLPVFEEVTGRLITSGRFLSDNDQEQVANVCVLGSELARFLFPFENPLDQFVRVGSDYYRVVGLAAPRVHVEDDSVAPSDQNSGEMFVPLSTGQKWYGDLQVRQRSGSRDMEQVQLHEITIEVDEAENVTLVADACREMLAKFHDQRDWTIVVPLELLARARETKRIFNIVLGSIAGISLIVGGIGIMNVMLATVTERTREIGIRRALGAKRRHIVAQFLVETVVLSVGGGLLGVGLGLLGPLIVEYFADMPTVVTPAAPLLAFAISAGIGVVFGIYPAWRAASMDPVEALRHE